jgi:HEAT repeat protein
MTDARTVDSGLIAAALGSRSSPLRAAGALAIGQLHARAQIPRLLSLLSDPDTVVAANAAFALGLLRDSTAVAALTSRIVARAPRSILCA